MKFEKIIYFLLVTFGSVLLIAQVSCDHPNDRNGKTVKPKVELSYTDVTLKQFNKLEPPVTLFGKSERFSRWGVSLKDGNGKVHVFGNNSTLSQDIGESYDIGDTLIRGN